MIVTDTEMGRLLPKRGIPKRRIVSLVGQSRDLSVTQEGNGRGERIRTSDPLVPNQVRYQTALRPE